MRALPPVAGYAAAVVILGATATLAHDPIATKVSWDREVGPIVRARCVSCHSAGGPAPMSLATYKEARPWAQAIREEVLARRMPKWPVMRGYGDFANDPSLSPFEIALINAWVDGGAPERIVSPGQPAPPPLAPAARSRWRAPDEPIGRTVPCASGALPAGRLIGMRPILREGAAIRISVRHPDGLEEPVLWLHDFDPAFANTYWLRAPVDARAGSTIRVTADADRDGCRLTLLFAR